MSTISACYLEGLAKTEGACGLIDLLANWYNDFTFFFSNITIIEVVMFGLLIIYESHGLSVCLRSWIDGSAP